MDKKSSGISAEEIEELAAQRIAENEKKRDKTKPVQSTPLKFSVKIHELIASAESDLASASRLLQIAAEQFNVGAPLHPMLAAYFANAFGAAVAKPLELQARELTNNLHLTSPSRRPARPWLPVGDAFAALTNAGMSKNQAKAAIAADFDIDETTALKYYHQYLEAKIAHDSIE